MFFAKVRLCVHVIQSYSGTSMQGQITQPHEYSPSIKDRGLAPPRLINKWVEGKVTPEDPFTI